MRFFITGGAGFIGSWLSSSLLEDGHHVAIFDDFTNSSQKNLSLMKQKGLKLIIGDITNSVELLQSLTNYDVVIHLAAQIDVVDSIKNPEKTFSINVQGTKNLLDACIKNKVQNIIVASSAAVYGHPKKLPIDETFIPHSISPYGESKIKTEELVREYCLKYDLNGISLRFFNIYGKGQTKAYAGVITKFIENVNNNFPLKIFGDGTFTRDFIHISDIVQSIKCAILKIHDKKGNVYNIATGKSINIKKLAETILQISDKKLEILFETPKHGDIIRSEANITKAKSELNFDSKIKLEDGLREFF